MGVTNIKYVVPEDDNLKAIFDDYWAMDGWKFVYKVSELAFKYDNKLDEISKKSYAYFEGFEFCPKCNHSLRFHHRSYLNSALYNKRIQCKKCKEFHSIEEPRKKLNIKADQEAIKLKDTPFSKLRDARLKNVITSGEQELIVDDGKLKRMECAFNKEVHVFLPSISYNFLVEFCTTGSFEITVARLGVAESIGLSIYEKLVDMDLICPLSGFILPELKRLLVSEGLDRKTKTIFTGGGKLLELYKFLKRDNINVFPKVPISQFLIKEYAETFFEREWHNSYFIFTMVDFLITDLVGMPRFAVDYVNTFQEEVANSEKLNFRKDILIKCGVPHYCVNLKDLDRIRQNFDDFKFPEDLLNL